MRNRYFAAYSTHMIINKYHLLQKESMSIFNRQRNEAIIESNEEAIMAILLSLHLKDSEITFGEIFKYNEVVKRSVLLSKIEAGSLIASFEKLLDIVKQKGSLYLLQMGAHTLNAEHKESVFALACDIVYSSSYCNNGQEDYLGLLRAFLEINNATAIGIMRVMAMKNAI
jgi:hypothetical protein